MKNIIFINPLPIQYFAPLYKYLNTQEMHTSCWYCSDENLRGHTDREFNSTVHWDIPLLEGYEARFFRNYSWKPSVYHGFFGLINPGMIVALFRQPKSVVIVHGWAYLTNILVIFFAWLSGHVVCLRGENPLHQELLKSRKSRGFKRIFFRLILLPFIDRFLFIGSQNKAFYRYYGIKEERLLFVPYAVDNDRFQKACSELKMSREQNRLLVNCPTDFHIILFTAKFIPKKRPMDLLQAFAKLQGFNYYLIMVGDGELKDTMNDFIREKGLEHVYLPGFVNQSEIVKYYSVADVFVMCSDTGETWGLSVNEAMNFDIPAVVSDRAGCSFDLIQQNENGFVTRVGDVDDIAEKLQWAVRLSLNKQVQNEVLTTYSFASIASSLHTIAVD